MEAETRLKLIVIVGSAGSLGVMRAILARLPDGFPAATAIVMHIAPHLPSMLPDILQRSTRLCVEQVNKTVFIIPATIYVAPPDHHMIVNEHRQLGLSDAEPIRFLRPAADPLFKSAARVFQKALLAVVLSGTGIDGSEGVKSVKYYGGIVMAQDQETSRHGEMPAAAISTGAVDQVLSEEEIPNRIVSLVHGKAL